MRLSPLGHDRIQHSRHSPTGKARIHFQGQTLPRVCIHHAQHPDRPSALHRIVQKVQRPFLVCRSPRSQRLSHSRTQCFRFFLRIINPASRYTRCTRLWFTCSPARPSNTCSRRYPKRGFSRANSTSRVRSGSSQRLRLVAIARYRHRHQAARTPLAEGVLPAHLLDSRLQSGVCDSATGKAGTMEVLLSAPPAVHQETKSN